MFQLKVEGQEPGTVAVVQQVGYKLNSRVLRPSMVGVVEK
jgi:molecular chaperone GrpE